MNILAKLLFSKLRADIFRLLFYTLSKNITLQDIEKRLGGSIQGLQAELKKLVDMDLVRKQQEDGRTYYRANPNHPLYPEIRNHVQKAIRLAGSLKKRRKG
jgi:DNA-binding transcriptional regulator GbsR (MarR family)